MKKIVLTILFTTALMAANNANYFGIYAGKASSSFNNSNNSTNLKKKTQVTVSLGHYYGNSGRISAQYTYIKHIVNTDSSNIFSLAYDFILPLPVLTNRFSLYAGPSIGYTVLSINGQSFNGFDYGPEAGMIVHVIKKVEIEAGYRYLYETGSNSGINFNNIKMWYVGTNIRF